MFYPEATAERCTAALLLDVDPHGDRPVRDAPDGFTLGRYVNDRPYAASSLLSAALTKVFRTALRGESPDRPELAGDADPAGAAHPGAALPGRRRRSPSRCSRRSAGRSRPTPIPLDVDAPGVGRRAATSTCTLSGTVRLADALNQLYVLLPVLDDAKHYWVAPDEVDKLLRAGEGWLARPPGAGADHPALPGPPARR